jgi:hypothetical protein
MASRDGRKGFLPPLADQQGQGGGGEHPTPETTLTVLREGQTMAPGDGLPILIRDAGQEQTATIREAGGRLVFDGLPSLAEPVSPGSRPVGLPQIKDRQIKARQGIAQGAPAAVPKVLVTLVETDPSVERVPWLATLLKLKPLMARQACPFRLPVPLRARSEGCDVAGGHFGGNA